MKRMLMVFGVGLMLAGTAVGWRPSGWVYHDHPWAYDAGEGDWYWFNPDTQWVVNMSSGAWATLPGSALATGWVFYQWPYGYAQGNGAWHWINEPDVQWVVNMGTSAWSRYGESGSPPVPDDMVQVPGGTNAGTDPDYGGYSLTVESFYMDRCGVTKARWDEVHGWATNQGYAFDHAGSGKGTNHPVQTVSWYDCVKWCNARSERDGREPVYYTDGTRTQVYRTGQVAEPHVEIQADGFRQPTDEQRHYAARGGVVGHRFPWADSDEIQHARANYNSRADEAYDTSPTRGEHPTYATGGEPYTSPVGSFAANGYGLYDMAGNVYEWCQDWHPDHVGTFRVLRGGWWSFDSRFCRVGNRSDGAPDNAFNGGGFRTVLPGDE